MASLLPSLVITAALLSLATGATVPCCNTKTVGGVEYSLVTKGDTPPSCLSSCIYQKSETGGMFCFAAGTLPVACGDPNGETRGICAGYLPGSDVTQHWKIDLDQRDLEDYLSQGNFTAAEAIYANGGNSLKTAKIELITPLGQSFSFWAVVAQAATGATGYLTKAVTTGETLLNVKVTSTCIGDAAQAADSSGCFTVPGGPLTIDGIDVGDASSVNIRIRTLAGFSADVEGKMAGYDMFEKYRTYYGAPDYAHKFITAALTGQDDTGLTFSDKEVDYRVECAKKGSAYWSVWMYMIWEMEDAIKDCSDDGCVCVDDICEGCNDGPVHAWDEAWAFYTGSLEGESGDEAGIFPYRLAETLCTLFGTCSGGKSKVNSELVNKFRDGKELLDQSKCAEVAAFKTDIMKLMSIPLIQGTLHYAIEISGGDASAKAGGVAMVGAILPQLSTCSTTDANTVKNLMWMDGNLATTADGFKTVKDAFERNYACMGIKCADIGTHFGDENSCTD